MNGLVVVRREDLSTQCGVIGKLRYGGFQPDFYVIALFSKENGPQH